MAKNYVKINGIKIGPPAPGGWTAEDVASWNFDENGTPRNHNPTRCQYVGGLLTKSRCTRDAESGNAYCSRHIGKGA
jgi:hypothetical protein